MFGHTLETYIVSQTSLAEDVDLRDLPIRTDCCMRFSFSVSILADFSRDHVLDRGKAVWQYVRGKSIYDRRGRSLCDGGRV